MSNLNLDKIISYLDRLKYEVVNIKEGILAPNNFISYTTDCEEVSSIFEKNGLTK